MGLGKRFAFLALLFFCHASTNQSTQAQAPADAQIAVFPAKINLSHAIDRQSIVVQQTLANGITYDLTSVCSFRFTDPIAEYKNGFVVPKKNGASELIVAHQGSELRVPVEVANVEKRLPVSFSNDVMPVFSRKGCNTGSCHGAARGQDGFNLSLFGFDPRGDHFRLTREMLGRRINLAVPEDCLLINKATGSVAHSGGSLMSRDSEHYQTLLRWLETGATDDGGKVPTVKSVELYPKSGVLNGADTQHRLVVLANYSDGSTRDVTQLSYFSASNEIAAAVSPEGIVTAASRGESFVMARFGAHTVGSRFIVLPKDIRFQWPEGVKANNYIDQAIHEKLKKLRVAPSEICSDAEFIRRVTLDLCGQVPTPKEVRDFVADGFPDKRSRCVDRLLQRSEFSDIWVMKWAELLKVRWAINKISYKGAWLYFDWIKSQISNDVPVDKMVIELLGSKGETFSNPAANFWLTEPTNQKIAENVAQVFMGTRIQCAQCHNHPFDRWTMDDYYSFASFFSKVTRKAGTDPREKLIFTGGGSIKNPVTRKVLPPKFLGGERPEIKDKDPREVLAQWLASNQNPWFAKNLVNVTWAHFLGRGIVHEVDDFRVSNPPVNPELLDQLAQKFTESGYNFKSLVRDICNSRTYQLSTQTNATNQSDLTNFSHGTLRRIRAEVLLDVISQITGTKDDFRGLPPGGKAVQIPLGNTSNYFLDTFGRTRRETVCSCEVKTEPNLSQALHLINGQTIENKVRQGGLIKRMVSEKKDDTEIIRQLYFRCLSRKPTDKEFEKLLPTVAENKDRVQGLEDIFWALLNSREFLFNH